MKHKKVAIVGSGDKEIFKQALLEKHLESEVIVVTS
jgi:hypothetical protein